MFSGVASMLLLHTLEIWKKPKHLGLFRSLLRILYRHIECVKERMRCKFCGHHGSVYWVGLFGDALPNSLVDASHANAHSYEDFRRNIVHVYVQARLHSTCQCEVPSSLGPWPYYRSTKAINPLTPNNSYRGRTAPLTSNVSFYIFIQQIWVLNILNVVYTLSFFSSKCSLFHNSNIFGSCTIHILYTGCAKIKKIIPAPKR
jgi:hypothetical protein